MGGSGGRSPPENFGDFLAIFQHFRTCEIIFCFLRGSGGEAPGNFLRFFNFLTRGGATENFFLTFWCLKKIEGGGSEENFFPDVIFLRPLMILSLPLKVQAFLNMFCKIDVIRYLENWIWHVDRCTWPLKKELVWIRSFCAPLSPL